MLGEEPTPRKASDERALAVARPRLEAALRKVGYTVAERDMWLARLSAIGGVSEDELVEFIEASVVSEEERPSTRKKSRTLMVWRHDLSRWWNHGNPLIRLVYAAGWIWMLWTALRASGLTTTAYIVAIVLGVIKIFNHVRDLSPKNMPMLKRSLTERQLLLERLLHTMEQWRRSPPTTRELATFQREGLLLIASYMRDHRSDRNGKHIFANLLVQSGMEVVVVARSDAKRPVPQRYLAQECKVVWRAMESGQAQFTGDVNADFPGSRRGRQYRSILALPIKFEERVVGCVSIDSDSAYHFDRYFVDLQTELAPYVQLLAAALIEDHAMNQVPALGDGRDGLEGKDNGSNTNDS